MTCDQITPLGQVSRVDWHEKLEWKKGHWLRLIARASSQDRGVVKKVKLAFALLKRAKLERR